MSISRTTTAIITIAADKEALFRVISDHEGLPRWAKSVVTSKLIKEGSPRNGVGAVREMRIRPSFLPALQEEVIAYREGEGYTYKIVAGMPGIHSHLGEWILTQINAAEVQIEWRIRFEFKRWHWFRLALPFFMRSFAKVQQGALDYLKAQPELYTATTS